MSHLPRFLIWSLPAEVIDRDGRILVRPLGDRENLISAEQLKIPVKPGDTVALSYAGSILGDIGRLVLVKNHSTGDERQFSTALEFFRRSYDVIRMGAFFFGLIIALAFASTLISSFGPPIAAVICATIIVGIYAGMDALSRRGETDASRELMVEAMRLSALAINLRRRVTTRGGKTA